MVIKHVFFNHKGGFYHYRTNEVKLKNLCEGNGFSDVRDYLNKMFNECPSEYFNSGPRSSCLKFKLVDDLVQVAGHEVSTMASLGLKRNKDRFSDNHSKVQVFMLENDKNTVAMEVPLWLNSNEIGCYKEVFKSDEPLTGHIDILKIEDDNIWIWDYKPNAHKELYAATQIFFYALMLSRRTKIKLDKFRCGYFDQNYAFLFKPKEDFLIKINKQTKLF